MKKYLIFFLLMAASTAMAAGFPVIVHTIMGGVIKSISWADPAKGTKSEMVVLDPTHKKTNIVITPTTTLWDADAHAIMPEQILPKKKVNVIYQTNVEGLNIAKSIKVLK